MNPLIKATNIDGMNHVYQPCARVAVDTSQQYHHQLAGISINSLTCFDVINGRGQGVQRHPGNVKYRTLVFLNKGLYAKCPRTDKVKISKGIVAAVRELGGRFVELDIRSGIYHDIGDKKACAKTSQTLREGQTKIRKQIYSKDAYSSHDTSLLVSSSQRQPKELPLEGYFGYSIQLLESLYQTEETQQAQVPPGNQISACPSHMNAALSLVELSQI